MKKKLERRGDNDDISSSTTNNSNSGDWGEDKKFWPSEATFLLTS